MQARSDGSRVAGWVVIYANAPAGEETALELASGISDEMISYGAGGGH